jgi:hypothetical protein
VINILKEFRDMLLLKMFSRMFIALFVISATVIPATAEGKGDLVIVPSHKLPEKAHRAGQAMKLHLVSPDTLYLYVEQDNGRSIAVFDVSHPSKIALKAFVTIDAPAPFDFVETVGRRTELIRYTDGSGNALLDLSKPKLPGIKTLAATASEAYTLPIGEAGSGMNGVVTKPYVSGASADYQLILPSEPQQVFTVKEVIQRLKDEAHGTTYLLGSDGLTVIRDLKREGDFEGTDPVWRNTIDDN